MSKAEDWKQISGLQVVPERSGTFDFSSSWSDESTYTAPVTGVYLFAVSVVFLKVKTPVSVMIAVNNDKSKRRALYATKGDPDENQDTVMVSGVLLLQKGKLSLTIKKTKNLCDCGCL